MKKMALIMVIFLLCAALAPIACLGDMSPPHTIYGYATNYQGALANGITIVVSNTNTGKYIKTTTVQGKKQAGLFQTNLNASVGDKISVYASYWGGDLHYYGMAELVIPKVGYLSIKNVTTSGVEYVPGGGGGGTLPEPPRMNHLPVLSNDTVTPERGLLNTLFYFNVTYADADNEPPYAIFTIIDGTSRGMSYLIGNNLHGAKYSYHVTLAEGDHTCWFFCSDGYANSTDKTTMKIIHVFYPLVLSKWGVSPLSGHTDTNFTYTVTYTSREGIEPTYIYVSINGTQHPMEKVSGDVNTGEVYKFTLNDHPPSPTIYEFVASDGNYRIATKKFDGPLVTNKITPTPPVNGPNVPLIIGGIAAIAVVLVITLLIWKRKPKKEVADNSNMEIIGSGRKAR
jgi:hypothetical protein